MKTTHLYITVIIALLFNNTSAQVVADYRSVINNNNITIHVDSSQMKYSFEVKKLDFKPNPNYIYHWYSGGKILQNQGSYSGKVLHGYFTAFYPNKQLANQGHFKKGLKKGHWLEWTPKGLLLSNKTWKKGIEQGSYTLYNDKGEIAEQGNKKNNLKQGKIILKDSLTGSNTIQYYYSGIQINKDEYINLSPWRRTGKYLKDKWKGLFRKKQKSSTENLEPQPYN